VSFVRGSKHSLAPLSCGRTICFYEPTGKYITYKESEKSGVFPVGIFALSKPTTNKT